MTTWIKCKEYRITKRVVSEALGVPLVRRPTFPYTESFLLDDVISLLCGRSASWGSEPRINSSEFVRTYVIHLLGTYVTILCNWLIF